MRSQSEGRYLHDPFSDGANKRLAQGFEDVSWMVKREGKSSCAGAESGDSHKHIYTYIHTSK